MLNGIAYDAAGERLFVTGKLWPRLFEIQVVSKTPASGQRSQVERQVERQGAGLSAGPTRTICPVTCAAASLTRALTTRAVSSGDATVPVGDAVSSAAFTLAVIQPVSVGRDRRRSR